jgi:pyridoxine 5-phosphate synthase
VHPRPDQRHIRPNDVHDLAALLADYPRAELNIEGNPFHGVVDYVEKVRPTQCTLVPDEAAQATSDHGWDLSADGERLRPIVAYLRGTGCRVSLFVEPDPESVSLAKDLGANRVELYTESYAAAFSRGHHRSALAKFRDAALAAGRAGVGVNAGHDLNMENLGPFLADVPDVLEVSIGHALISDALQFGLSETVRKYLALLDAR